MDAREIVDRLRDDAAPNTRRGTRGAARAFTQRASRITAMRKFLST
jgi:hypothetical protein